MYGDSHPFEEEIRAVTLHDIASHPDLMMVMGTSLTIPGICYLVKDISQKLHAEGHLHPILSIHKLIHKLYFRS
jgi:NAD-dependent SIR2 family protein deacetylase